MLISDTLKDFERDFLKERGKNPDEYALVRIEVYSDTMNESHRTGMYDYMGEGFFLIPKQFAHDVTQVAYNFTHTNIRFFKEDNETVVFTSIGEGYDDIEGAMEDITAFHVGDYEGADIVKVLIGTSITDNSFSLFHPVEVKEDYYDENFGQRIVTYDDQTESWMNRTDIECSFYRFRRDELEKAEALLTNVIFAGTEEEMNQSVESLKALAK